MRVGLILLPEVAWREAAPRWREAERWGFDHAWTYDHLSWRTLSDGPWFASVPTLAAAALVTSTIRLGTFVSSPNFRHPVPFAKELMTLDDVSAGRLLVGVGAGAYAHDADVLGAVRLNASERADRFAEFVELLDRLLRAGSAPVSFAGRFYTAVGARMVPGSAQQPRPPFVVAANGPRGMGLAARFGQGWVTTGTTAREDGQDAWWRGVGELARRFDDVPGSGGVARYLSVDAAGDPALGSLERAADAVGRAAALGFTDVVLHRPRPSGVYAGDLAVLDAFATDVLPTLRATRTE